MNEAESRTPIHPWISLETPAEIEGWIELNNQELQALIGNRPSNGHGICLQLLHGGELVFHTNGDGDVILDVTPEAAWVTPVILATTKASAPRGQIWLLPYDALVPLLMGLNTLIAGSHLVLKHAFRTIR